MARNGWNLDDYRWHPAHPDNPARECTDLDVISHARRIPISHSAPVDHRTNSDMTVLTNLGIYGSLRSGRANYSHILRVPSCPNLQTGRTDSAVPIPNFLLGNTNIRLQHPGSLMVNRFTFQNTMANIRQGLPRQVVDAINNFDATQPQRINKILQISKDDLLGTYLTNAFILNEYLLQRIGKTRQRRIQQSL